MRPTRHACALATSSLALIGGACAAPEASSEFAWFDALAAAHQAEPPERLPAGWQRELVAVEADEAPQQGDALLYLVSLEEDGVRTELFVTVTVLGAAPANGLVPIEFAVHDAAGAALGAAQHEVDVVHLTNGVHAAAEELLAGRERLEPEELNPILAGVRSLQAVLAMVNDDSNLAPLLGRILDKPSAWSVLTQFGIDAAITLSRSVATTWSVPRGASRPLRTLLRLDLNASPALRCSIVSIAPRAPYSAGAGIVSMVAVRPDGSGARLCLHLIGARTGRVPTRRAHGSRVSSTQDSAPTTLALPREHQRSRTLQIVR